MLHFIGQHFQHGL